MFDSLRLGHERQLALSSLMREKAANTIVICMHGSLGNRSLNPNLQQLNIMLQLTYSLCVYCAGGHLLHFDFLVVDSFKIAQATLKSRFGLNFRDSFEGRLLQ